MGVYELEFKKENVYTTKSLPADEGEKIIYVFRDKTKADVIIDIRHDR